MPREINLTAIAQQIEAERARIRAKVQPDIDAEWEALEARQAQDTEERNAMVAVSRERRERRQAALAVDYPAATAEASDANIEGEPAMAIDTPATTDAPARKGSTKQRIQREMSEAAKRGKPASKTSAKTTAKAKPAPAAKNGNGKTVHIRKRKGGDFILIHNPNVYGSRENWAISDTFKTLEGAEAAAKKHGLKVASK